MKSTLICFIAGFVLAIFAFGQAPAKAKAGTATAAVAKAEPLDINTATAAQLIALPGIGEAFSKKIIDGRPYSRKDELVSKKVLSEATYERVKDLIVARQVAPKGKK